MTTSTIEWTDRSNLDLNHEDLRPISRQEFRAVLLMVASAFVVYIVVMALFVR